MGILNKLFGKKSQTAMDAEIFCVDERGNTYRFVDRSAATNGLSRCTTSGWDIECAAVKAYNAGHDCELLMNGHKVDIAQKAIRYKQGCYSVSAN